MRAMTKLSVNVNKIAVLRNSRGGALPSPVAAVRAVLAAGAHGITVHPRPDQRHVRADDVDSLAPVVHAARVELNIEGNPFAPSNASGYPGLLALIERVRPAQATFVPDGDGQITSDHGFDLARDAARLKPLVAEARTLGARVSLFVDEDVADVERAADIGADRIEIYTGPYAHAHRSGDASASLARCAALAACAQAAGLGVNAGHDLDQNNLGAFLAGVPRVLEVSIGHALIGEALYDGLDRTVRNYLAMIAAATR